jgi:filamentous hemagglutinin family protein
MKRGIAALLCLCIAFMPAIANAGAGARPLGYFKPLLPPLPKPKVPGAAAPPAKFDLTVARKKTQKSTTPAASSLPSVSPDELPGGWTIIGGIKKITTAPDKMVITQNAAEAIIDWQTFDVGSRAEVDFVQKSSSWICLNEISSRDPSQIFGRIDAIGKIYLINQNGILFMRGSQVDLNTLIASSLKLDISNQNFFNGDFTLSNGQTGIEFSLGTGNPNASVENYGTIAASALGSVYLVGPSVTNDGKITTRAGQIGLIAGSDVTLTPNSNDDYRTEIVDVVKTAGDAVNNGQMVADTGLIGMYGVNVEQNGVVSATAALSWLGEIDLEASGIVSTGAGSVTSTPVSESTETEIQSTSFSGGKIDIGGLGLTSGNPAKEIVNCGLIQAHHGEVILDARQRVFLQNGSSIDVSGNWIDESALSNTTRIQLNGVELRDYPDQKNGILRGSYITVNNLLGSSIGDISQYLNIQERTAMQQSLQGGSISITAQSGDVIVKQDATLNFSGGGVRYSGGYVTTTGLIANNKVYSIDSAPENLTYTGMTTVTTYVSSYVEGADAGLLSLVGRKVVLDGNIDGRATAGVYQTGASELLDKMGDQKTSGLQMPAGGTLLIGTASSNNSGDKPGNDVETLDFMTDCVVLESAVTPLPYNFGPYEQLYDSKAPLSSRTTYLSTQKLSEAGLADLEITSNTTITVEAGADISLNAGLAKVLGTSNGYTMATVSLVARAIDIMGEINVPSGAVQLWASDNEFANEYDLSGDKNPLYTPLQSEIYLAPGSVIDVAGQRVDNSLAATGGAGGAATTAFIAGGTVDIEDLSFDLKQGVVLASGSLIDVGGGYGISHSGAVTGGNAGSLTIQGMGIVLDGTLRAYSLEGNNGGKITLHAESITVEQDTPSNSQETLGAGLILGSNELADTGFTMINLESFINTTFSAGALSPSLVKLANPVAGEDADAVGLITVSPYLAGTSYIDVTAQSDLSRPPTGLGYLNDRYANFPGLTNAAIEVSDGAELSVAPQGSISLNAPYIRIDAGASMVAPAGTVNITAGNDLTLDGTISAAGYNLPEQSPSVLGLLAGYTPLSGGSVTLSAGGPMVLGPDSVVNVSGSSPVTTYVLNNEGAPVARTVASNPGSISITASTLSLEGMLKGQAELAGLQGGALTIILQAGDYVLSSSDFTHFAGFDDYTFKSQTGAMVFSGSMDIRAGRSITLEASSFTTLEDSGSVSFEAPWIELWSANGASSTPSPSTGTAQLTFTGKWIDLEGGFDISGFKSVKLSALNDITLTSLESNNEKTKGYILTGGDLTLQADRIYPSIDDGVPSQFTISSEGNITIEGSSSHNSSPVYSAGGSLAVVAQNIDMEGGALAAPMGQISLTATGNVTIADGSLITTAGSISVYYGSLSDIFWTTLYLGKENVTAAPQGSVNISGNSVTVARGAKIDVSGGGGIFAYEFLEDTEGSVDPFQNPLTSQETYQTVYNGKTTQSNVSSLVYDPKIDSFRLSTSSDTFAGRWVIVPGADYSVAASTAAGSGLQVGEAVYLQAAPGLKAGVYTLLPEQYAFLPGAMIITDTGTVVTSGTQERSGSGYSIVAGYLTCAGTSVKSPVMYAFEVQSAADVLQEGNFNQQSYVAGNAGSITITATSTVVEGKLLGKGLSGYEGGTISLSGAEAYILASAAQAPSNPGNALYVTADSLSGNGFQEIDIGNLSVTSSIEMKPGAILDATEVVLSAQKSISLDNGAQINTVSSNGNGSVTFDTPDGALNMNPGSVVHASDRVTMILGQLNYQAGALGVQIDHGALDVIGQNVYFLPQGGSQQSGLSGLFLTSAFWSNFSNFDDVNISATGGYSDGSVQGTVGFLGSMNLSAKDTFTINAAAITGYLNTAKSAVTIDAPTVSLLNRGGPTPAGPSLSDAGSLTLNADRIYIGEGDFLNGSYPGSSNSQNGLLIDGFATVNFNAKNDVTFQGAGALVTGANINFSSARITTSYFLDEVPANTAANTAAETIYTVADFTLDTSGAVTVATNGVTPSNAVTPGGTLEIDAKSIIDKGVIQMSAGTLTLSGTEGVTLGSGARVLDSGTIQGVEGTSAYASSPGGSIYLKSDNGAVGIEAGSVIDVSGAKEDNYLYAKTYKIDYNIFTDSNDTGVNAGLISIYSPNAAATLEGTIEGTAGYWKSYKGTAVTYGKGGSFALDADGIINTRGGKNDFSSLLVALTQAGLGGGPATGFTESIDIRVRGQHNSGDLVIKATDAIYATNVNLTADNGSIYFYGKIDSPGSGGTIQFNSGETLTLEAGSTIESPGATVFLNTGDPASGQTSRLNFFGTIDVGETSGQGGVVHFRGSFMNDFTSLDMDLSGGSIIGASQILAEGVLFGTESGISALPAYLSSNSSDTITSYQIVNWYSEIQEIMTKTDNGAAIKNSEGNPLFTGLKLVDDKGVTPEFVPGLEIDSRGALTLSYNWDFTNLGWDSFGPGFLTLRAAGDLDIYANLVDHPSGIITSGAGKQSWSFNLVAGADMNSADFMRTQSGSNGALYIGEPDQTGTGTETRAMVYTEGGNIWFASAGETWIGEPGSNGRIFSYMINSSLSSSLGSFSGDIQGKVGGDLDIQGGAIQTAIGDIDISVGGNLNLSTDVNGNLGTIRTTGESSGGTASSQWWTYQNGGSITIDVRGSVNGLALQSASADLEAWDSYNMANAVSEGWSASYTGSNGGRVTQGLATMAGGNLTVYAGGDFDCQAGTFSPYAYTWSAHKLISSVPMNDKGNLTIVAGGDIYGRFLVTDGFGELRSMGNFGSSTSHPVIEMFKSSVNVTAQGDVDVGAIFNPTVARVVGADQVFYWDLEYTHQTSVSLTSASGSVSFYGDDVYYPTVSGSIGLGLLPPTVTIYAAQDINVLSNMTLAPYAYGELKLAAGGSISGPSSSSNGTNSTSISMPDESDALTGQPYNEIYGPQSSQPGLQIMVTDDDPAGILHAKDTSPVIISAGGDISNLSFYLSKAALIAAGGDINNIYYVGYNDTSTSVTKIKAGGDIVFESSPDYNTSGQNSGIEFGGAGTLVIEAGGSIDLGTSAGIQVVGNAYDTQLPGASATLIVAAGYSKDFSDSAKDAQFFDTLRADGVDYSIELAAGDTAQAGEIIAETRSDLISPFFQGSATAGSGDVDMTYSQITNTTSGIYIFTNGKLNAGSTSFISDAERERTGILTSEGGAINIFANSDVNVNESRVMTFMGGNITVWSDTGSINAGRGSKTVVDTAPPELVKDTSGDYIETFSPPSVGSGIRALTYDAEPLEGLEAPPAGNIYLFAPEGDINAGEAGIAGRNVILGALQVLNANNISYSQGEIGVPLASAGLSGLASLTGTGAVQAVQAQEAAIMQAATGSTAQVFSLSADSLTPSSIDVKVVSFYDIKPDDSTWEETDN